MSMMLAMALAAAGSGAGPTKADLKLLGPVKDSQSVHLDPNGAYILLRSPAPVPINLFRIATPEEVEDYRARRVEALAKAHKKWKSKHADWVKNRETYRAQGINADEPVEPTEANLAFPPLDQENLIGFGPLFRFAKAKGGNSTYLQRVWPGRYVVYGSVLVGSNGATTGMCVCMGTVAFDAKPGEVVDIGSVKVSMTDPLTWPKMIDKAEPDDVDGLRSGAITMMRLYPQDGSQPIDPRLSAYKVVPAKLGPAGPVPNYYGVQVDRLTAIPGVLAYDRDRIVDVAASSGAQ
jgi:hypothetical protein